MNGFLPMESIVTIVIALVAVIASYSTLKSEVSHLKKEVAEMKDKSHERQKYIYGVLDEIRKDIHDIQMTLAKMNGG